MIFSNEVKDYVTSRFNKAQDLFGYKKENILYRLSLCNEEERFLMKYLYSTMPLSDISNYDFELFYAYVKHAIFLRKNTSWATEIPEDIFLNYVLHYRINDEAIEDCRRAFYDMIHPRLEGKGMYAGILEVNYWCAENATYKSTDERTLSPLGVLKCGYGRCGEESTLTVTALRSVGIPARQIYTPKWAHCDDNHAWVEVWCDGKWHYLGACEPEPVLDKGWFTSAASRAMVIHSRVFTDFYKDEEVISKNKVVSTINNINKYAVSKDFAIRVVNSKNHPVEGAEVRLEIINYSELSPIAILSTDFRGLAHINIGLGTLYVNVVKDGRFIYKIVDTRISSEIIFNIDDGVKYEEEILGQHIDMIPPSDKRILAPSLTEEEKVIHKDRLAYCNRVREEKNDRIAAAIAEIDYFGKYNSETKDILLSAMGNHNELLDFLNCDDERDFKRRIGLLMSLSKKDYLDSKSKVLNSHIENTIAFNNKYSMEIYFKYVLCPRIFREQITDYRQFIINYFDHDLKENFKRNPTSIWDYIMENIKELPEYDYPGLFTVPAELLSMGIGNFISKKILFVAISRSLGIPSRINSRDMEIEYYSEESGKFIKVENCCSPENSRIIVNNTRGVELKYYQNWTMAFLENGIYRTLDLCKDILPGNKANISVRCGQYRILTSNRLPNGSVLVNKYILNVKAEESKALDVSLRDAKISDMLENYEIENFNLRDIYGKKVYAFDLMKNEKNIIIWIEEGKEPTEHILNEMIALKQDFINMKGEIIFVLKDPSAKNNKTLQKVYELIPTIKTYYDDFTENVNTIARRMYLDPEKLPLVLVLNRNNKHGDFSDKCINGIYACSGYNVGIGELLIRVTAT